MRGLSTITGVVLAAAGCMLCAQASAQTPSAAERPSLERADWPMERVEMFDGRSYPGLIESEDDAWVNLAQIQRVPGRPMHVVIRPIERRRVAVVVRLDPPQHDELRKRIEQFVNRASIEAGRMDAVSLTPTEQDGQPFRHYRGKWFSLDSTIDDATTRRIIVRTEQVFLAYRQVLPPRRDASRPLRLLVFASPEEYHAYLERLGLKINNGACYLQNENLVLAGSDVARFAAELAKVNARHEQLRHELEELDKLVQKRLKDLAQQLQKDGANKRDTARLLKAERRKAQEQLDQKDKEIGRFDRENSQLFDKVTRQMFTRLYHEAFHAYLENYVFPHDGHNVPLWLNEGLAVLFESGLIESDTLRIDAPNAVALRALKADLAAGQPLELASLLASDRGSFAMPSDTLASPSDRYYLYAWGLAYYLTFERHLLGSAALDQYVEPSAAEMSPVARFERLVGMPLAQFQQQWRDYIAKLR